MKTHAHSGGKSIDVENKLILRTLKYREVAVERFIKNLKVFCFTVLSKCQNSTTMRLCIKMLVKWQYFTTNIFALFPVKKFKKT
jgi:hypothetical protein